MNKKLRYFIVSREVFSELFKNETTFKVENGLPIDAEIISINYKEQSDTYNIIVYSETFRELEEAEIIPEFKNMSFRRM